MAHTSINLRPATIRAFFHNTRSTYVSYVIDDSSRNEYTCEATHAVLRFLSMLDEAFEAYKKRTGQRIQTAAEKFLWEAVVVLEKRHTIEDVERLATELEKRYGWRSVQIAVHRDEGYVTKDRQKVYNYHAHIVFCMLDSSGIYRFKKRDFGVKRMSELQSLTARVLGMRRGIPKWLTGTVRLEAGQYKKAMAMVEAARFEERRMAEEYYGEFLRRLLGYLGDEKRLRMAILAELGAASDISGREPSERSEIEVDKFGEDEESVEAMVPIRGRGPRTRRR